MFDNEYIFRGKHARMVKKLTEKIDDIRPIFKTNYDVYAIAPLVGLMYNKRAKIDEEAADSGVMKVSMDEMIDKKEQLIFNYRLIMMYAFKENKSVEERMIIAFKLDDNEERKLYDEIYDDYIRGGVEIIYDKLLARTESSQDIIKNMYDFFEEVNTGFYQTSSQAAL